MECGRILIIVVGSNQCPPSIEEVDDHKYPQGELVCKKQKKKLSIK